MTPETQALVERQIELLGQCEAFIAERFDIDDGDAVALGNSIHAIRKTLESVPAALASLSRDLVAARQERDAAQSNYDGACRTIALMHEAATGRSGEGPHLGVVEDVAAAVRAARAETWAEAAAWHEGMAESSVIPSLRPLHQQYAANFRERARLVAREEQ